MKLAAGLLLIVAWGTACAGGEHDEPVRLHAVLVFPPRDTVLLDLPAETRYCDDGGSILIESLDPEGDGMLLRLRYRDSLTSDSFPIVIPTDLSTVPAAVVAIRFFTRDTPRGLTLDSGSVRVRRRGNELEAEGGGVGVENAIAVPARFQIEPVPIGNDSVPCAYRP